MTSVFFRRIVAGAAAAVVCSVPSRLPAQDAAAVPAQTPTFRSSVELVSVDVGVVDRQGQPIRDLGAADFTVTVAGQPRRVVSVEYVDVEGSPVPEAPSAGGGQISTNEGAGTGRLVVFVVDQGTLEPGNVRQVARAAAGFLNRLSFADRSALMLMPAGPNLDFTWAHDKVRDALQRVVGHNSSEMSWESGSLSEARDIATRGAMAVRFIGQRECGNAAASAGFGGAAGGPGAGSTQSPGGSSGSQGGRSGGSGGTQGGGGGGGGGSSTGGSSGGGGSQPRSGGGMGLDNCTRELQMRAEWMWRSAQMTSLASISSMRQVLAALARVPGDKTVILISGGWPLDDREQQTLMTTIADEAAAARATIHSMYVGSSTASASRRTVSTTPVNDEWLRAWPLETLSSMTGGGSFRVEVGAESAFNRLQRELRGYYRLGVEQDALDRDGKPRRMKVQVARGGVTVRARNIFDIRTYHDRDWAAQLATALDAPIVATGIGLRVTSYLAPSPEDPSKVKLVLTGEASRVDPGEATIQVLVRDLEGNRIVSGEQPIGRPVGDGLTFSANLPIEPGSYIIRVAVVDGNGRVGSVDHRAEARPVSLGPVSAAGPVLIRVPIGQGEPRFALSDVRQDERLALQLELQGDGDRIGTEEVSFEIAADAKGPALLHADAEVGRSSRAGSTVAHAVADMRVLPPGEYVARATITEGGTTVGTLHRRFVLVEAPRTPIPDASIVSSTAAARLSAVHGPSRAVVSIPRFGVEQVLQPAVLTTFLDQVAARPDAAAPMIRDLIASARTGDVAQIHVSDVLAAESPVAAFLHGLSLLSQKQLEPAAAAFRSAMRASADFYPAMVYLGACYAAGGKDKEAAGAWRTALIKESDAPALHLLLADALLRQEKGELALQALDNARARWPADDDLKRRFVIAALLTGEYADGLAALDELIDSRADDEPSLAAGLLALYEAVMHGNPIEDVDKDRARMIRLADAYRTRGGPSLALIDSWLAAAKAK